MLSGENEVNLMTLVIGLFCIIMPEMGGKIIVLKQSGRYPMFDPGRFPEGRNL